MKNEHYLSKLRDAKREILRALVEYNSTNLRLMEKVQNEIKSIEDEIKRLRRK